MRCPIALCSANIYKRTNKHNNKYNQNLNIAIKIIIIINYCYFKYYLNQ